MQVLCAIKLGHTRITWSNQSLLQEAEFVTLGQPAIKLVTIIVQGLCAFNCLVESLIWLCECDEFYLLEMLGLLEVFLVWPSLRAHKTCTKNYMCRPRTHLQIKWTSCFIVAFFTLTNLLFLLDDHVHQLPLLAKRGANTKLKFIFVKQAGSDVMLVILKRTLGAIWWKIFHSF